MANQVVRDKELVDVEQPHPLDRRGMRVQRMIERHPLPQPIVEPAKLGVPLNDGCNACGATGQTLATEYYVAN